MTLFAKTHRVIASSAALAALALLSLPATVNAQMKPGLWEITTQATDEGGLFAAAMAESQRQMANMPPEQRKMMEAALAKQGISMGAKPGEVTATSCVTQEMAARKEIPLPKDGGCKATQTPTAGGMNLTYSCTNPPSNGTGQVMFQGDSAFTMTGKANMGEGGEITKINVNGTGKWLSADCGTKARPR